MSRFIPTHEAVSQLETTASVVYVTACNWRKQYDQYPIWYKVENGKTFVDIDYLIKLRDSERTMKNEAVDLYYFITEDIKMKPSWLAVALSEQSELYNKRASWLGFMQRALFSEPIMKFYDRTTRLQEFYRVCKGVKDGSIIIRVPKNR